MTNHKTTRRLDRCRLDRRRRFLSQFPVGIVLDDRLVNAMMPLREWDGVFEGVEVFQLLNKIIVRVHDEYYTHGI